MDIKDLLALLKVDSIEVWMGSDNSVTVRKIRDARFKVVKEDDKESVVALVLTPDRQSEAKFIPEEVLDRLWKNN